MNDTKNKRTARLRRMDDLMSARLPPGLHRIVRFGIAGLGATVFYFVLTTALASGTGLQPASASIGAYLVALILSYLLQSRFAFRVSDDSAAQITRFIVTAIIGLAVSYGVMALATEVLDLHYIIGAIGVCILIPAINFVIFSRWVFARHAADKPVR